MIIGLLFLLNLKGRIERGSTVDGGKADGLVFLGGLVRCFENTIGGWLARSECLDGVGMGLSSNYSVMGKWRWEWRWDLMWFTSSHIILRCWKYIVTRLISIRPQRVPIEW